MYRYDKDKKILYMSKLPIDTDFHGYELSDHYLAFKNYLYNEPKDITDICLRNDLKMLGIAMSDLYNSRRNVNAGTMTFEITDITEEDYNAKRNGSDYSFTTVEGRFKLGSYTSPVFPMLRLPEVDRFGMIRYKKQLYSVIATSEPSKYITYNGKNILNIMLNAVNVKITHDPRNFSISFGKNKLRMTTLLYGVCYLHKLLSIDELSNVDQKAEFIQNVYTMINPDATEMLKSIVTSDNVKWIYANEDKFEDYEVHTDETQKWTSILNYANVIFGMFGFANISKNGIDPYALYTVREQLNEIVNIDRGIGKILSRDIYSDSLELLAEKGDLVTRDIIAILNTERINCYYVVNQDILNQGGKIACDIALKSIPIGVLIPDEVRMDNAVLLAEVPDITQKKIEFVYGKYLVIRKGTLLTAIVMQLIQMSELTDICQEVIESNEGTHTIPSGEPKLYSNMAIPVMKNEEISEFKLNNVVYVTFEEEIMGNRHFKTGDKELFVTEDGEEAPPAPHLTVYDIAALMSIMPRMADDYIDRVSDKDMGLRKHICLIDEHIHKAMKSACNEFPGMAYRTVRDMVERTSGLVEADQSGKLENTFWALFNKIWYKLGGSGLTVVQLADTTNPAALTSWINRVNTLTESKHGVSDAMRFLAMGVYGRICPYETPASSKLGLTNTKAIHAHIRNGELYTSYYKVVHIGNKHKLLTNDKYDMTVAEEEKFIIADLTTLELDSDNNILNPDDIVAARVPSAGNIEKMEVQNVRVASVEFVNCYVDQVISPTASLIPYMTSNDATRVSFGLNMARQSRPLVHREIPLIVTKGFFDIIRATTVFQINAEDNGVVEDILYINRDGMSQDSKVIVTVRYDNPVMYRHPNEKVYTNADNDCVMQYQFLLIEYSYKSVIERKVEVRKGDFVNKGDVIMSSNFTKNGVYAPGVNAFIGIAPVGYNYEDGVKIANRLSEKLSSYGHTDDTFVVRKTAYAKNPRSLNYVESNATRIIKWEDGSRKTSEYATSNKLRGYVVRIKIVDKDNKAQKQSKTKNYRVDAIYISAMNQGDKECNRHGNKGVVPKKVKNSDMMYLLNGEHIDMFYNPAGIASRMNLGQLKEIHIGLACHVLQVHVGLQVSNEIEWEEAIQLLNYAYDCANSGVAWANSQPQYQMYPEQFRQDIVLHEKMISKWKGTFTRDGRAIVINPETGKPLRTPIVIGINQVTKLIQEVEDKQHARGGMVSDSRYELKSGRPTKGARKGGGQAFGSMEWNSLLAYSVPNYIHELMHERGDNPYARQLMNMEVMGTLNTMRESDIDKMSNISQRRSFEDFANCLKALNTRFEIIDAEDGIVDPDSQLNADKFLYMNGAVLGEVHPFSDKVVEARDNKVKEDNINAFEDTYDEEE